MSKEIRLLVEQMKSILNYKTNIINESVNKQVNPTNLAVSKGFIYINFIIDPADGDPINRIYPRYFLKNQKKPNTYYMKTGISSGVNSFFNGNVFPKVIKTLSEKGYNIPSINELIVEAENEIRLEVATPEEKTQAKEKYEDLVVKILSNLNDSKMQELISKISDFRVMADIVDNAFGHKFSGNNALRALAVKPDATFLATRNQWSKYNRKVNPNATKVLLWIKTGGGSYDQEKAEKELGISKSDAYKSTQMKHKFDLTASSNDSGGFMQKIYYDISDTTLEPNSDPSLPSSDKIIDEPGLIDNLKGVLNQMAIDKKGINLSPEERASLGAKDTSNKNVTVFSRVLNYMRMDETLKNITDNLIQLEPADDMSVYKVLKAYFMNVAFARASDDRELKSNIGTAGILAMDEIAPTALAILLKQNQNILKLEKSDIISVFGEMMKLQRDVIMSKNVIDNSNMTNEGQNLNESSINTPEDLIKLFGYSLSDLEGENDESDEDFVNETEIEETNQEIKKSFFEVYNKLNNKNLLY
jgi:hypothetical protein